jgi:glycosyltransferase involved in cell wall biosynthesis
MKILVLTKRQYMGKDLLDDRFGRFRELPLELARLGHEVRGLTLSYRGRDEACCIDTDGPRAGRVEWRSVNLVHCLLPAPHRYFQQARQLIAGYQPDLIWAASDAYHAIFGHRLAREFRCKLVIDLYDNFEAFTASKVPGVRARFRDAVRQADGVSFFSQRMADHVSRTYPLVRPHAVILSGVRKDLFYPMDRSACRRELGLPGDAKIIGIAGALDMSRGIDTLFAAFETLAAKDPRLHLALAGARTARQKLPTGQRVHDFHLIAHGKVPVFLNALDLAVVCYRRTAQGEYSFPQKAYEIIACGIPLVAAAVGSMNELLHDYPDCRYEPDKSDSLAASIRRQLEQKIIVKIAAPSWADSARRLNDFFQEIISKKAAAADPLRA